MAYPCEQYWGYLWKIPSNIDKCFDEVMKKLGEQIAKTNEGEIRSYTDIIAIKTERFQIRLMLDIAGYTALSVINSDKISRAYFLASLGESLEDAISCRKNLVPLNPMFDDITRSLLIELAIVQVECDRISKEISEMYLPARVGLDDVD